MQKPQETNAPQRWQDSLRALLPSLIINVALPIVIYQVCRARTSASEIAALLAASAPAALWGLAEIVRRRAFDALSLFTLAGIATSLLFALLGGDPRLFLVRESALTAASGVACLATLLTRRPAMVYLLRTVAAGRYPERWETWPKSRAFARFATAAWGVMTLGEFAVRVILIYRLTILEFLTVDRFLLYGSIALYTGIIWAYGKSNGTFQEDDDPPRPADANARAAC